MEKFGIKSQNLSTQYEYENDDLVVSGSYKSDKAESVINGIDGTAYRKADGEGRGEYVGNFTGTPADGEMEYSLSKMSRAKKNLMWAAIDGIESNIVPSGDADGTASGEEGGEA